MNKRPFGVRHSHDGTRLIWGDKFGELFECPVPELRRMTHRVVSNFVRHFRENRKDVMAKCRFRHIMEKFPTEVNLGGDLEGTVETNIGTEDTDVGKEAEISDDDDEEEEESVSPFAGHLAQITALEVSGDGKLLLSGDRDEKVRVGSLNHPYITTGYALGHTEFITALSCPKSIPTIALSAAGDRHLKIWDISTDPHKEGCVELCSVLMSHVPSVVEFFDARKSFLVVCEDFKGVFEVPLIEVSLESGGKSWKLDNQNIRTFELPSVPMSVIPFEIGPDELKFASFSTLHAPHSNLPRGVFFWIDREGRLHLPIDIISGESFFSSETWKGSNIGDPIPPSMLRWWKHNREPTALTEVERIQKRLKHSNLTSSRNLSSCVSPLN